MENLISVIITVYNNENTLRNSILSVIGQTYRNIEIIIIDDGSTDNSSRICDELLLSNARLKVHHQIHLGISGARNKGIQMSSGKYITFLNATDSMSKTLLENLNNMMDDYSVEVSICRTYTNSPSFNSDQVITFDKTDAIRQLLISDLIQNNPYAKLFDRNLFSSISFSNGNSETIYNIFERCSKIAFMNKSLYRISASNDDFYLNSILNRDTTIMTVHPELEVFCKCNIVKAIQNEFYDDICNNKPIPDEQKLYEMFLKIVKDSDDDSVKFYSNIRKAHMYLLADSLNKYKIICPVLPELEV